MIKRGGPRPAALSWKWWRGTGKLGTQAWGCREVSWVFKRRQGEKKTKMDFRCRKGTSEDQRMRRGVGLRRCLQGKDERSPISRKSAGLETAANRKRSHRRERPKKMKITPLLCLRPKPPNQEYLLFFWEIGLFLSSGRTKLQLTRGPFRLCLLGLEPSSWSAICVKHWGPGSSFYCLGSPWAVLRFPPRFSFSPPPRERCFAVLYVSLWTTHYKVFLEQVGYINFKIERRLVRQKTRRRKCERKLDWKDEETREIRGNLKRPKSPKLGKTPLSTEVCGTSSLRCMWVRCVTKGICKCGEKKAASLIKMVKSVGLGLCWPLSRGKRAPRKWACA